MAVYQYQALDQNQNHCDGTVQSESARGARDILRGQGLTVQSIDLCDQKTRQYRSLFSRRIDVTTSLNDLGIMLGVGVPLDEGLRTIISSLAGNSKRVWLQVSEEVSSGKSLSDAFQNQPATFDSLTIALIKVGENSGTLDEVIGHLSNLRQKASKQKGKVLNAMLYPMVVFFVACLGTIFLMTNVLPALLDNLTQLGKELPFPTKVLKFVSDLFVEYWILMAFVAVISVLGSISFYRSKFGRDWVDRNFLKIPLLGQLVVKQEISRVSLVLSILLKSGMDFLEAIRLAESNTKNTAMQDVFRNCRLSTERGKEIGSSFDKYPWIPAVVIQVFSVGQQSGNLPVLLGQLSSDYDRQVELLTERVTGLIEPIMILTLSIVIGFIVFATFLPILESGNGF